MKHHYSVHIVWSKEDEAYLAAIEELPGCVADGSTPEQALSNVREIAQEWIETAKEEKRSIPLPRTVEDCESDHRRFQQNIESYIQTKVSTMVREIFTEMIKQEDGSLGRISGGMGLRSRWSVDLSSSGK
jgi:predicted RNase H-like HicB family nuclease